MNIIAINGSPRKHKNTANLLNKALAGAAAQGANTELIHLYDLEYKGCISCFACKLRNGKSYGKCAVKDGLTDVLDKIANASAVILGSPIYFGAVTGNMRSFMERLLFPYLAYTDGYKSIFNRKILTGFIYTMNVTALEMQNLQYDQAMQFAELYLEKVFGAAETLVVNDTYQFDDYSKYDVTVFDEAVKAQVREQQFPKDCQRAFEMGARFASQIKAT